MRNVLHVILTCVALFGGYAFAQPICGFDQIHGKRMRTDSSYRNNVIRNESNIRQYIQLHQHDLNSTKVNGSATKGTLGTALYIIPVVVHVIHTGGAVGTVYNPLMHRSQEP